MADGSLHGGHVTTTSLHAHSVIRYVLHTRPCRAPSQQSPLVQYATTRPIAAPTIGAGEGEGGELASELESTTVTCRREEVEEETGEEGAEDDEADVEAEPEDMEDEAEDGEGDGGGDKDAARSAAEPDPSSHLRIVHVKVAPTSRDAGWRSQSDIPLHSDCRLTDTAHGVDIPKLLEYLPAAGAVP